MTNEDQPTPEVDVTTALRKSKEDSGVILDVREPEELQEVAIPGVLHIPLGELHRRLEEIPQDSDVFIVCRSGRRSAMATDFLRQNGRERVWNIRGGMIDWVKAGLPVEWEE